MTVLKMDQFCTLYRYSPSPCRKPSMMHYPRPLLLLLVLLCDAYQALSISLPILKPRTAQWTSSICTTNITIPTPTAQCVATCAFVQDTQTRCKDFSICMCPTVSSDALRACFSCILDGAGSFMKTVPDYVEATERQISSYSSACQIPPLAFNSSETFRSDTIKMCARSFHSDDEHLTPILNYSLPSIPRQMFLLSSFAFAIILFSLSHWRQLPSCRFVK